MKHQENCSQPNFTTRSK